MTVEIALSDPNAAYDAARQAHDARDWPRAATLWQQLRTVRPDHPLGYTDGTIALREIGDLVSAEAVIAEGLIRCPEFHGCYMVWADLAMRRRDWPEATIRWAEARRRFPKDGQGYVHGAHALQQLGRMDDADRVLEQGRAAIPNDPWVLATWGYFAQHHRDTEEALRRFEIVRRQVPHHPAGYVSAAITLRDRQRYQEAEAILAGALLRFPNDASPAIDFASIAQARGDRDEAIDRWRVVRERYPDHPAGYTHAMAALRTAGRGEEAEALLASALERFPNNPHLYFEHAWAAHGRGDRAEVARRWAVARERFPGELVPYVEHARALLALDRRVEADATIDEGRRRFPADLGVAVAWADLAMRRRDWPEAAARWQTVRTLFPNDAHAVTECGRALLDAGRPDDADALLGDAAARFSDHAGIARAWADVAMRRHLWAEAVSRWAIVRERFPDRADGFAEGARALRMAGRTEEAEQLLDAASERFPAEASIRFAWAELASARGDWIEAHRRWDAVRARFPHESRAWNECANALTNGGRTDEADAVLREALAVVSGNLEIVFNWALHAARFLAPAEAAERWRQMRETFPDQTTGYTFGAHTLQDGGRTSDAEALIAIAAARFPNNPDVSRNAAEIAAKRGDFGIAADRFAAAVRDNPNDVATRRRWIEVLDALQRFEEVRDVLTSALDMWPGERVFLDRLIRLDIKTGRLQAAFARWRSVTEQPELAGDLGFDLAWALYCAEGPADIARATLLYLLRQPDSGSRDWLPKLAGMVQARGPKPDLFHDARRIVAESADSPSDPATMDVLRCALLLEYSDADIIRFLRDYVGKGRAALTAHLFCQNYWKAKPGAFGRFVSVFERYLAAKLDDPSWIRPDNATEMLGYLNFAAVHSDDAYARLVGVLRGRLDLAAMQSLGLPTIGGVVGTIALSARIDPLPAPGVHSERRLRIAVCVSGQLRGYRQAVPTWSALALGQHDVSYYVHVWKGIGRNWERLWGFARPNPALFGMLQGPNGLPFLRERFPLLAAAAEARAIDSESADTVTLREIFRTDHVQIENDDRDMFRNKVNLWKMPYMVEQAHKLARSEGREFDLMIRMRPDRTFEPGPVPDWHAVHAYSRARRVVFTDMPYMFTERQTWMGDQYAAGTQDVMDVYSHLHSDMETYTRTGSFPPDVPEHIRPHTNLFFTCFYRGVLGRPMPGVSFGPLLDRAMLTVADVYRSVRDDVSGRPMDDLDRQMIAACEAAMVQSNQ